MVKNSIITGVRYFYLTSEENPTQSQHIVHSHNICELYFFVGGECSYIVENGVYKLRKGTVVFTRPGEMHGVHIDADCIYERCYFSISPDIVTTLEAPELLRCFYNRPHGQLLGKINTLMEQNQQDAKTLALAAFLEILHDINCCVDDSHLLIERSERSPLVNRAMRYINLNLAEIRSTADVAAALYVQREYLSRKFSENTGIPLNRYITLKRIARAKIELIQAKSIAEVCTLCGWKDDSYFITVFHREVGMTPMQYKKNYRTLEN